ncbi:PadR family transcriptional regulator [Amycolatopsis sp. A133]|uniref:PadR family transcriptional regulator n=1 Tax=Amycolatopsis sp. A133 TaxID=3064472 RepID=UPI0027FB5D5C|nr:PadR family transcriptional regulator [Amycolatopsis sp. A133]MDQ7803489.1 PadR family transcriptional regulator [Amycolatopsis sp. A133]
MTPRPRELAGLIVLGLLLEHPRHPYELQRICRERHHPLAGGLYHAINRLNKAGFVEACESQREGRRPERTVYRITGEGREEFFGNLGELLTDAPADHTATTTALSMIVHLPPSDAARLLGVRRTLLEGRIAALDAQQRLVAEHAHRVCGLELEHLSQVWRAELTWLRSVLTDIERGDLDWNPEAVREDPGVLRAGAPKLRAVPTERSRS